MQSWGLLGIKLNKLGTILDQSGGNLEPTLANLGQPWGQVGPTWRQLEPFCGQLGRTWRQLKPSWHQLGPTWGQLAPTLGPLAPMWAQVRPSLYQLGVDAHHLGPKRATRNSKNCCFHLFFVYDLENPTSCNLGVYLGSN